MQNQNAHTVRKNTHRDLRPKDLINKVRDSIATELLESQDPEVEQHSSSTYGPTTKGPAMTEPTDMSRQARLV
jgi:hypothetical protein